MIHIDEWVRTASAEEFAEAVKEQMAAAFPPITQGELARWSGKQPQHVSKWLQAKTNPGLENRLVILKALRDMSE